MNFSFINNFEKSSTSNDMYKNNDFYKQPDKLYRNYPNNVPLKNYQMVGYENTDKNNWPTQGSIQKSLLHGTYQPTPLGELFFNKENIRRIQNKIKKEVYLRTNGQYVLQVEQNESDLLVIMRAVFIQDAIHEPYRLVHQIKELNKKVVQRIVPDMISQIKQDQAYLKEISSPLNPIALPVCMNNKGLKGLRSWTTTFDLKMK